MASRSSFWSSFKRELGKNSGKWISNKIFGNKWSTPYRNDITINRKSERSDLPDNRDQLDSRASSHTNNSHEENNYINIKNVETNEFDVDLLEVKASNQKWFFEAIHKQSSIEQKKGIKGALIGLVVIGVLLGVMSVYQKNEKQNDNEKHLQLQNLEMQIQLSIQSGNKERALELVQELNHPSDNYLPDNGTISEMFNRTKYQAYWQEKKQEYIQEILALK